ncbi:hypothetical protein N9M78_00100 [Alphaproteobacteria bacterium]|nr:hypothetical protein [Alphaproteobacteria bacterium]
MKKVKPVNVDRWLRSCQMGWRWELAISLSLPPFDPAFDRIIICGSIGLNQDIVARLLASGFRSGIA